MWTLHCRCLVVLPLLSVKCHSSLKEGHSQMFILSYAAIKRLRNIRKHSHFLKKKREMVNSTSSFTVTLAFRLQLYLRISSQLHQLHTN